MWIDEKDCVIIIITIWIYERNFIQEMRCFFFVLDWVEDEFDMV